jgi:hypothetical protein
MQGIYIRLEQVIGDIPVGCVLNENLLSGSLDSINVLLF